jgi:medium-chain acyl-[acyl-carrier-protein] hydrolase
VLCPRPRPAAAARLLCLPYAGGGASVFRTWPEVLPATIELRSVQPPGREGRLREPAFTRMDALVSSLTDALSTGDHLDRPFAVFGHSMGALIGFELVRELRRLGGPLPVHLFVAGHAAPQVPPTEPELHDVPDEAFADGLRRLEGTPEEVLAHPGLMQLLMPLLRADFELCETYAPPDEPPIDVPISAFGGLEDHVADRAGLEAWAVHTSAGFRLRMVPGGHFFLQSARELLVRGIVGDLMAVPGVR